MKTRGVCVTPSYLETLQVCEADLRAGRAHVVSKRLASLNTAQVPRELRLSFANLCRRAGLFTLGLKLLAPIVYPERNKWRTTATSQELAEYAVLLQKTGAVQEAMATLAQVDTRVVPEALLFRAFCHFARWEYEESVPVLQSYIDAEIPDYARFVGAVNLAAAYVSLERREPALELLARNLEVAKAQGYTRLLGNCHELRAQVHLQVGDFEKARFDLSEAEKIFESLRTFDQLFVSKWLSVMEALELGDPSPIERFRAEALERQHWESVREADLYRLKVSFDKKSFDYLLFGTPFSAYRERIQSELGVRVGRDNYLYGREGAAYLDLLSGEIVGETLGRLTESPFNPGKKTHQLIEILLRDFYRPIRLGGLFAELFPGDHFDVFSSPDRVHQALRRAREAIIEAGLPIEIIEAGRNYSLRLTGDFSFLVPYQRTSVEGPRVHLEKLQRIFSDGALFSAKEAREKLGLSLTSFNRLTVWALEHGHLERLGSGPATKYRVAASAQPKAA